MSARPPINLMLVEDERIVAFDLKRQLQGFGYQVGSIVASGEQAIERIAQDKPDLVLMDIHLDGKMDGIEAAIEIRSRRRIPVVYLTAYAEDDTLHRALDSRPFGYLIKPCEARELHATIQMALARREDELAVEESEERLKLALDSASLGVLEWNPALDRLTGDSHFGMLFANDPKPINESMDSFIAHVDERDRDLVREAVNSALRTGQAISVEFRTRSNGRTPRHMEAYAKAYGNNGEPTRVVGILKDVTQRHQYDEKLRQSGVVFDTTAEAIVITDASRQAIAVNRAFSRITGFSQADIIGTNPDIALRATPGLEDYADLLSSEAVGFWHGEVSCHRKDGVPFPAWQSVSAVRDAAGNLTHYVTAFSDVTAIHDAHRELNHLAHHDPLTGLPNRLLFDDRLNNAMEQAQRNEQRCLVMFLDLDGFKMINDTLGHAAGDELLRIVASRLRSLLRSSDTVARLGGDEFVILTGIANPEYAVRLAQKVLDQLRQPIEIGSDQLAVSASLGIAVYPDNGEDGQELMRAADMAMYTAKAEGRDRFHFYAEDMSQKARERMYIEQGLRRAVSTDALSVYYQPRVDLETDRIVGVEALVRWTHPERGLILPDSFIPIAEDNGIIEQLGHQVLERACREMSPLVRQAREQGNDFHVAVNVSARQFLSSDFVATVRNVLVNTGFPATLLELEITESTLQATERSRAVFNELKQLGVSISIDDFGTGYSSLSVLRDLPVDRVKIDRSFIIHLPHSEHDRAVIDAIVGLSRAMGMAITVEGIETHEQASILRQLGCDEGQGFLFGAAMTYDGLIRLLSQVSQPR